MIAGDALLFEPAEQPPQFGPQDGRVREAGEEGFNRIQDDPLGPDRVDGVAQANEQALQVILARLLDLAPLDANVVQGELLLATSSSRSKPSERTFCVSSSAVSSKAISTPGSSNWVAPRTRNSMPSTVLPQPALPQTKVGRPRGRPPRVSSSSP